MTANPENVKTADGGVLYLAPLGTPLPESATDELDAAFMDLGYWANDGSTITPVPGDEIAVDAHNGDVVIRKNKKGNVTLQFPFIELTPEVFEVFWDTTIAADGSYEIEAGSANTEYVLVYDTLYSDATIDRKASPRVGLQTRAAVKNNESDPVTHDITFGTKKATGYDKQIYGWNDGWVTS